MSKILDGLLKGDLPDSGLILSSVCTSFPIVAGTPDVPILSPDFSLEQELSQIASSPFVPGRLQGRSYKVVPITGSKRLLVRQDAQVDVVSEQYRVARTKITKHPLRPQSILISSSGPGDGKTTCSIELAAALSLSSQEDVLLIDADFRRNSVSKDLGLKPRTTLVDVLQGQATIEETILRIEDVPALCVLPSGHPAKNPAELLESSEWASLFETLKGAFRYIIIDAPPVFPFADYELLQGLADGILLVISPDHSNRQALWSALKLPPRDKFLGIVLNRVTRSLFYKPVQANYYYYGGDEPADTSRRGRAQSTPPV